MAGYCFVHIPLTQVKTFSLTPLFGGAERRCSQNLLRQLWLGYCVDLCCNFATTYRGGSNVSGIGARRCWASIRNTYLHLGYGHEQCFRSVYLFPVLGRSDEIGSSSSATCYVHFTLDNWLTDLASMQSSDLFFVRPADPARATSLATLFRKWSVHRRQTPTVCRVFARSGCPDCDSWLA